MARISTPLIFFFLLCLLVGSSLADLAPEPFDDLELPELDKRQDNNSTSISLESTSTTTTTPRTSTTSATPTARTSTTSRTTPTSITLTTPPLTVTSQTPATSITSTRAPVETPTDSSSPIASASEDTVTATPNPTTRVLVTTIFTTLSSNGAVSSYVTSSTTTETPIGSAAGQAGNNNNTTRNTIIGVVVGVGGALLVGGLAIVAWRLRRKRVNPVDEDDLMRRDGSPLAGGRDSRAVNPEASPFKATLDQYHKPPGVVNTSSNF